jgi:hypothetical protein
MSLTSYRTAPPRVTFKTLATPVAARVQHSPEITSGSASKSAWLN